MKDASFRQCMSMHPDISIVSTAQIGSSLKSCKFIPKIFFKVSISNSIHLPLIFNCFFPPDGMEPHQGRALGTHPWVVISKPRIQDPTCQNRLSGNPRNTPSAEDV